jgi:hypothetical protein
MCSMYIMYMLFINVNYFSVCVHALYSNVSLETETEQYDIDHKKGHREKSDF